MKWGGVKFADVGGKDVLAEEIAGVKALRQKCAWCVEKESGDRGGWSGVNEGRLLGDGLGDSLESDVRPAHFQKQVQAEVFTPLMIFFSLLPWQAMERKNREDKSTAKIQP